MVTALVVFLATPSHDNLARQSVGQVASEKPVARSADATPAEPAPDATPSPAPAPEPSRPVETPTAEAPPPPPTAEPELPAATKPGLMEQALKLVDEGKAAEAEGIFQQILQEDPNNQTALSELAMIHLIDKKDPQGAMPFLEQVVRLNPDNQAMVNELINAAHQTGRIDETLQFLQTLPGAENGVVEAGMGKAYQSIGEASKAIPHYEKALQTGAGDREQVLESLGDAYLQTGDFNKALGTFQDGITAAKENMERDPGNPMAKETFNMMRIKAATVALDMGRRDDASRLIGDLEKDLPQDDLVMALKKEFEEAAKRPQPEAR